MRLRVSRTFDVSGLVTLLCMVLFHSLSAQGHVPAINRDQIQTERRAIRLLARPGIQMSLNRLEREWQERFPDVLPSSLNQVHSSMQELAFLVALETINSDARRPKVIQISLPPHHWGGIDVPGGRWGIDNPDTQYFIIPLEAASRYVITGHRHQPGPIDSNFSFGTRDNWATISNISHDHLRVSADGEYTITLNQAPAKGRPNHIQLTADGDSLFIRNTLADWSSGNADRIAVKRISGPAALAEPSDEQLERSVVGHLETVITHIVDNLQTSIFKLPANVIPQPGKKGDKVGFLVTQRNAIGHFHLGPNQAMVATINPGGAAYATFPVTNIWGVSPDNSEHQCSLNNQQAIPNPDGTFTVVLSEWDPGIANWVDTSGLEEGILMLRWQRLPDGDNISTQPSVQSQIISRGDLSRAVPVGMKTISSEERRKALILRRLSFYRRFFPLSS